MSDNKISEIAIAIKFIGLFIYYFGDILSSSDIKKFIDYLAKELGKIEDIRDTEKMPGISTIETITFCCGVDHEKNLHIS